MAKKKTAKKKTAAKKTPAKKTAAKKKTAKKKTPKKRYEPPPPVPYTPGQGPPPPRPKTNRSAKKKKAALAVVCASTSDRMAQLAQASVWAISSEKTLDQFEAIEQQAEDAEETRLEGLVDLEAVVEPVVTPGERRSARDPFVAFRAELAREEDEEDPHADWRHRNQRLRHELNPGASAQTLAEFEEQVGRKLPPSFYDFALEWDGGLLYVQRDGTYRVVPVSGLLEEIRGPLCGTMTYPYLPVVDLGSGDYLALDMSKSTRSGENPLYWWHAGEAKRKVAESFSGWLKKLVDLDGLPYWWDV